MAIWGTVSLSPSHDLLLMTAKAIEAALMAITSPGAIRVADGMLHEAGYVSRTEEEDIAAQTEQAIAAQQMQQQAQQQPQQPQQPQALGLQ